MRKRLAILSLAMVLAIGSVLAPFSRVAYANTVAIEAGAYALFTVLGLFGFNAGDDAISDPVTAWNEFTGWMDDLSADVVDEARAAARASNPDFINNALDWDAGGKEAIEAQFLDWGEQGTINLDGLSIMAQSGALGLIPFVLSLYMVDRFGAVLPDEIHASLDGTDFNFVTSSTFFAGYSVSGSTKDYVPVFRVDNNGQNNNAWSGYGLKSFDTLQGGYAKLYVSPGYPTIRVNFSSSERLSFFLNKSGTSSYSADLASGSSINTAGTTVVLNSDIKYNVYNASGGAFLGTIIGGSYSGIGDWITDNPDVIGGSDYWDDAKDNKDILNPAAGAAVIGADAVFDGDYIKNRGSIGVFSPADYADINSWADALARAHAGVAQGTLDGTISNTTTGTAVDIGTGELVTDTVGELTKPDGGHSTSKPKDTNGRDPNDWKIPIDLSKYFPFCIPFDIIALFEKLGSGASTFSFEPFDAPAFDAPFKVDGVIDESIHLDFADWSGMMANIRMLEFFVFLVGLAMVTRNIIRG